MLGGGGYLGAHGVGMLHALVEHGVRPDVVLGTSVGAINGAVLAAEPTQAAVDRLARLWPAMSGSAVFGGSTLARLRTAARTRTHVHSNRPLRTLLERELGNRMIEDLAVPYQCVAAGIEQAAEHWFDRGPLVDAVLASSAVPGLLPPVAIGGQHYIDGGIVHSIPLGRAVDLGALTVFVLQVGRIERPLSVPTTPWEVATVTFEIARRHRFAADMARAPAGVTVHVLPTGEADAPLLTVRYRDSSRVTGRISRSYAATADYLRERGLGGG